MVIGISPWLQSLSLEPGERGGLCTVERYSAIHHDQVGNSLVWGFISSIFSFKLPQHCFDFYVCNKPRVLPKIASLFADLLEPHPPTDYQENQEAKKFRQAL